MVWILAHQGVVWGSCSAQQRKDQVAVIQRLQDGAINEVTVVVDYLEPPIARTLQPSDILLSKII